MSQVATIQRVSGAAWIVAALLSAPAISLAEDPEHAQRLSIVAGNVLAPVWASPVCCADALDSDIPEISDEVGRIEQNLRRSGSDHFPIGSKLALPHGARAPMSAIDSALRPQAGPQHPFEKPLRRFA